MRHTINKLPKRTRSLHKPNKDKVKPHTCIPRLRSERAKIKFDAYAYRKKLRAENSTLSLDVIERMVEREHARFDKEMRNRFTVHPHPYCVTCGRVMTEINSQDLVKIAQEQQEALRQPPPMYQEVKPVFEQAISPFETV